MEKADIESIPIQKTFDLKDEKDALEMKTKLSSVAREKFNAEIVTEIIPAEKFYRAEEYHQQYFAKSNL